MKNKLSLKLKQREKETILMKNGAVTYIYTGEGMNWNLLRVQSPHLLYKIYETSLLLKKKKKEVYFI